MHMARILTRLLFLFLLGALGCAEGRILLDPLQSALADYLPTEGLVASLGMNEKDGLLARDSTPNQNDGTLTNPTLWRPLLGHSAGALALDGSDVLIVRDSASLTWPGAMTLACWIQVPPASFDVPGQTILSKGSGWSLSRFQESPYVSFRTGAGPEGLHSKTAVNDGQWHHVVGVHNGARLLLYIDGKLEEQRAALEPLQPVEGNLWIGGNAAVPDGTRYKGLIDDVLLYKRALSAAEVVAIAEAGPGVEPDQAAPSLVLSRVLLKGTVADVSGVAKLTLNGKDVTLPPDGAWEIPVDLTQVDSEWTLEALDVVGNSTKTVFAVHLELAPAPGGKAGSR